MIMKFRPFATLAITAMAAPTVSVLAIDVKHGDAIHGQKKRGQLVDDETAQAPAFSMAKNDGFSLNFVGFDASSLSTKDLLLIDAGNLNSKASKATRGAKAVKSSKSMPLTTTSTAETTGATTTTSTSTATTTRLLWRRVSPRRQPRQVSPRRPTPRRLPHQVSPRRPTSRRLLRQVSPRRPCAECRVY